MINHLLEAVTGTNSQVVTGIFKALLVSVALPLFLFLLKGIYSESVERRSRRRDLYANALAACKEYMEFPYVIYRRNATKSADERTRISEALRDVQKRISYHQAWLKTEDRIVAARYDELVNAMRDIVGEEMKRRWKAAPIKKDADMVVGPKFNWGDLPKKEAAYVAAVNRALKPFWRRTR